MDEEKNKPEENPQVEEKRKVPAFGIILIVVGAIFILQNALSLNIFGNLPWEYIWPVILILFGIHIISKKSK